MVDAVADIGNSRIKICRCDARGLVLPVHGLGPTDVDARSNLVGQWQVGMSLRWAVAATNAASRGAFIEWAEARGDQVEVIDSRRQVPIPVQVDEPDRVGI